jgi:hypothetical protein
LNREFVVEAHDQIVNCVADLVIQTKFISIKGNYWFSSVGVSNLQNVAKDLTTWSHTVLHRWPLNSNRCNAG